MNPYASLVAISCMGRKPDGMCRHCDADLWKRRDQSGNSFDWVSFLGISAPGADSGAVTSRFCPRQEDPAWARGIKFRTQHAPLRLDRIDHLERWLEKGESPDP